MIDDPANITCGLSMSKFINIFSSTHTIHKALVRQSYNDFLSAYDKRDTYTTRQCSTNLELEEAKESKVDCLINIKH